MTPLEFNIRKAIREHNKKLRKKETKQATLGFANMRMKQLAPMAFVKNLPATKQKHLEGQVKHFLEDQRRQLERRKGKPGQGLWMFV